MAGTFTKHPSKPAGTMTVIVANYSNVFDDSTNHAKSFALTAPDVILLRQSPAVVES